MIDNTLCAASDFSIEIAVDERAEMLWQLSEKAKKLGDRRA